MLHPTPPFGLLTFAFLFITAQLCLGVAGHFTGRRAHFGFSFHPWKTFPFHGEMMLLLLWVFFGISTLSALYPTDAFAQFI
jgi:hypothetical protein